MNNFKNLYSILVEDNPDIIISYIVFSEKNYSVLFINSLDNIKF